jgi:hypothetical protein
MRRLLDLQHPWFRPIWRRVLVVAICLGWAIFELTDGAPFWAVLFGATGLYCAWVFVFDFHPGEKGDGE